jgi:hypothetical protein
MFSRVQRQSDKTTESESGSGWSREGLKKFNAIADMVKKDRELCGATFNSKLYKVFKNMRKRTAKSNCSIDPKMQRPLFYDIWAMRTIVGRRTQMNMFPLYAFKLVTACVNILLLSSDTSIADLTRFRIPRTKGRCCNK